MTRITTENSEVGMENFIQTLLNGYDNPAFLSDARAGTILFTNKAFHKKLGFSKKKLAGMSLQDLLKNNRIIRNQSVLEYNDDQYIVQNEELTYSGNEYTKSVLQPYSRDAVVSHWDYQKEMTGRLVHRLRSPLNGISGFSELLRATSLTEKQEEYLTTIDEGLDDLESILDQIQVLSKSITVYKTKIETSLLAEQILASFSEDHTKRINLIIDDNVTPKHTDFVLLKSIVEELLHNAIQHGSEDSAITLNCMQDRIRVNNEGAPIPEDTRDKMFYPFFSSKARNVGIGLTKCANYAHQLELELRLTENSRENGVSFDLIF